MTNLHCTFKASIVGCGSVGATAAYAYLLSGSVTDLTLVDIDRDKARGLHLDLEHSLTFTPHVQITATDDFAHCAGSNIVVVTAGARQKEGQTRLDLVQENIRIFENIIPKISKAAPNAILLIVSNPVDVLTYHAHKLSGFPKERVIGSGTLLDSARLQFHLSEKLQIHPSSVDAYILGEHGDSSFPVYSSANIHGKPLLEMISQKDAQKCYDDAKKAAYNIINDLGYTCYSISTAIREITRSIFEDQNKVFPLSVPLDNYYGHSDVCLSVPVVLGRKGIVRAIETPLDENEQKMLAKSVETIKSYL